MTPFGIIGGFDLQPAAQGADEGVESAAVISFDASADTDVISQVDL